MTLEAAVTQFDESGFTINYTAGDDDYVWPDLQPGTDYIALGYPMNGNGTLGYGATAKAYFKTTGTAPEEEAGLKGVAPKGAGAPKVLRPITAEQLKAVLQK